MPRSRPCSWNCPTSEWQWLEACRSCSCHIGKTLEGKGRLQDGKLHGDWAVRLPAGGVQEGPYVEGECHGDWFIRMASGRVHEGPYVDGRRHGDWKITDPVDGSDNSGRTQMTTFVQGLEHGLSKISWPSAQAFSLPFVRGSISGRSLRRFADGSTILGGFADSRKSGVWKHYRSDGSGWKEETFSNDKFHGPWRQFGRYKHCDEEKGNYVDGQKDGDWTERGFEREEKGSCGKGLRQGR